MTSYNEKLDYNKNHVKKNNFLMFFLIFLLLVLMVTSVLIFNRFTYSSKNIKNISSNYELKFIDIYQEVPAIEAKSEADESYQNIVLNKEKTESSTIIEEKKEVKPAVETNNKTTTKEVATKSTEEITTKSSTNIITSRNIQRYHNILLQQFKNVKTINYKVKWGDTLWKIAIKYNTTAHTIYVLNAFNNPNLIYTGQIIKVPVNFTLNKNKTKSILSKLINNKTSYNINKDCNMFVNNFYINTLKFSDYYLNNQYFNGNSIFKFEKINI